MRSVLWKSPRPKAKIRKLNKEIKVVVDYVNMLAGMSMAMHMYVYVCLHLYVCL